MATMLVKAGSIHAEAVARLSPPHCRRAHRASLHGDLRAKPAGHFAVTSAAGGKRQVIADSGSTVDIAPTFQPTSQGLLLSSFVARVQPAGAAAQNAQEMRISLEYQTVSGAQIPARLAVELPNMVTMDFALDGCRVNAQ